MRKILGVLIVLLTASALSFGQATSVNGGAIQGIITDPSGAVVPDAKVTIISINTGEARSTVTDSAGIYSVGPLNPGNYDVTIDRAGFSKLTVKTVVRTGTATNGNYRLSLGASTTTIEVNAGELQLNTEQAGVSDVITREQIDALPVNGRNFLDLAQVEPGVILQSGESFDPTKAGYSAISVSGVSGRTTRILLDGQDITDETVGTTMFNVSSGSIDEFQLNRSTQDVSGDVTSTGQLLVATRSGTNAIHGQLFYNFQDARAGFAASTRGINPPFQRNQFGGSIGGPIIKDKLFLFVNSERIKQDSSASSPVGPLFQSIATAYPTIPSPYRETYSAGRLDWNGPLKGHYFFRVNYNVNSVASNYGDGYWLYANRDNTPGFAYGADFAGGHLTHSFRGSYEKFHNMISDLTASNNSIYNAIPGLAFYYSAQHLYSGPNYLAPQGTLQSDKQFRYDGSWLHGRHLIRYGYSLNRILGGGFAAFFGLSPRVRINAGSLLAQCDSTSVVGPCASDPIHGYSTSLMYIGNGQGFFTENPGFGLPGGGVADWRQGAYIADTWKVTPSFTLTAGLRWSVDTDRANQDLATPLCSDVDPSAVTPPCSGNTPLFDQWMPGLGQKVHQPWGNFGPQLGFTYALPDRKTVIRAGTGVFYESDVMNNTTNARSALLKQGAFFDDRAVCGGTYTLNFPGGTTVSSVNGVPLSTLCHESLAQAGPSFIQLQQQYQTLTKAHSALANGGYVGETLLASGVYGAPYRTPYSMQWNGGVQRELWKGAIFSADYVHNTTLKIGGTIDVNHVGAARYLNKAAAQAAISATADSFGCGTGTNSVAIDCAIASGATILDFANNGLDSGNSYLGGYPASAYGLTPAAGAAFPGANAALGNGNFILPVGRSAYDAFQVVYRQQQQHPLPGVVSSNVQLSYNLSRITSTVPTASGDQFFVGAQGAWDYDATTAYMGRSNLDHTNQLSLGGSMTFKYGPRLSLIGHFYSAGATSLTLDTLSGNTAQIFQTDVTGDGTIGDLVPGTNPGDYMHAYKGNNLNKLINKYNSTYAGQLTPAGQALVSASLFTGAELSQLNAVQQPIATVPGTSALNNAFGRFFDMSVSYPVRLSKIREGMSLEPTVALYNVGNLSNFSPYTGVLVNQANAGGTSGSALSGYLNGENTFAVHDTNRVQRGSGTFDQGGPRSIEFQLKFNY